MCVCVCVCVSVCVFYMYIGICILSKEEAGWIAEHVAAQKAQVIYIYAYYIHSIYVYLYM